MLKTAPNQTEQSTTRHSDISDLHAQWTLTSCVADVVTDPADLAAHASTWLKTHCPGTVADTLLKAGSGATEQLTQLDSLDWWYHGVFSLSQEAAATEWHLVCDGLATLADVWLNGMLLGTASNMHRQHRLKAAQSRSGKNDLHIRFRSIAAHLAAKRERPRWRAPMLVQQQLRHIRTTLLGRTPGWSPPYPAIGPWRAMRYESAAQLRLSNARIVATLSHHTGLLDFHADLQGINPSAIIKGRLRLQGHGIDQSAELIQNGSAVQARLVIEQPALWWPHTHGEPAQYEPSVTLACAEQGAEPVTLALPAVGFRSTEIRLASGGFELTVNQVPVFCRGAVWTPPEPTTLCADSVALQALLGTVVRAGMNMLRISGAMTYESDAFYTEASRLGILVWQDFMFANMDYPANHQDFSHEVSQEISSFLGRVAGQACISVLCGNSEVEQQAAMWGATREFWAPSLFHDTIADLCKKHCPTIPYWPSSAHGGAFPHQPNAGTCSYYGVGAYRRPLLDARSSEVRFTTECLGIANVPDPDELAAISSSEQVIAGSPAWTARSPRDLGADWTFDDIRDHYLKTIYQVDPLALRTEDHDRYIELSRAISAYVMHKTFAEWRRTKSVCRGALVWFLKDLWPSTGWGLLAHNGAPKACWHALSRILQPQLLFITDEGLNGTALHIVNEKNRPLAGSLTVTLYVNAELAIRTASMHLDVPARQTIELCIESLFDEFNDLSHAYKFGPAGINLIAATLEQDNTNPPLSVLYQAAGPLLERTDIGLSAHIATLGKNQFEVVVSTRAFAHSVHIQIPGAVLPDNHFDMAPSTVRRIELPACENYVAGIVTALNSDHKTTLQWPEHN